MPALEFDLEKTEETVLLLEVIPHADIVHAIQTALCAIDLVISLFNIYMVIIWTHSLQKRWPNH